MLAAWKAGGIVVSINPMNKGRELTYLLEDSGAKVLITLESLYRDVAARSCRAPRSARDHHRELDYLDADDAAASRLVDASAPAEAPSTCSS